MRLQPTFNQTVSDASPDHKAESNSPPVLDIVQLGASFDVHHFGAVLTPGVVGRESHLCRKWGVINRIVIGEEETSIALTLKELLDPILLARDSVHDNGE